ncbi:MAG TPA: hypothetical protein VGF55_26415 [Gemmataceae bacterium]|jgi:hypothetical protein
MRPQSTLTNPTAFILFPADQFAAILPIDRRRVEELYRDAYEQARAVLGPPITERLAPIWN